MRDVLDDLLAVWRSGATAGVGTVIRTFQSAPRPAGASMAVAPDGSVSGSVSGGCVEGAVYEAATSVVASGSSVLESYGVSDSDAFAVGLTCGGTLDVFVEPISQTTFPELGAVAAAIEQDRPVAVATIVRHPDHTLIGRHIVIEQPSPGSAASDESAGWMGSFGLPRRDAAVVDDARGLLAAGSSAVLTYGPDGERRGVGMEVFVAGYAPRPRMLIFGAIDFAAAVAEQGTFLGYRVTVCDARAVFATSARFPAADDIVVDWPDRYLAAQLDADALDDRTVVCVLTHDPKFDVPLLALALRHNSFAFIGAMGSRRTHDERLERLRDRGLTDDDLARLASPIGLDLGARTPQETAVSIAAQIVANRWGGSGEPLAGRQGRIHHNHEGGPGHIAYDAV